VSSFFSFFVSSFLFFCRAFFAFSATKVLMSFDDKWRSPSNGYCSHSFASTLEGGARFLVEIRLLRNSWLHPSIYKWISLDESLNQCISSVRQDFYAELYRNSFINKENDVSVV
jgi:hypothetical protein